MNAPWVNIERETFPLDPRRPWGWVTVSRENGALVNPGHARTMIGARFAAWRASHRKVMGW